MAIIFQTSFEDYADGLASLIANGWDPDPIRIAVVTAQAHTGVKSVEMGEPGSGSVPQMDRAITPSGPSVAAEAWAWKRTDTAALQGLQIQFFRTGAAFGVSASNGVLIDGGAGVLVVAAGTLVGQVDDVIVSETYYRMRLQIRMSTVAPGGADVNADGCCALYINGVLVLNASGLRIYVDDSGWASGINHPPDHVQLAGNMYLDDVTIDDDTFTCASQPTPPTSVPCCGTHPPEPPGPTPGTPPGSNPGPVTPPNPGVPLPPWIAACAGGGTVPTAADQTDAEDWS